MQPRLSGIWCYATASCRVTDGAIRPPGQCGAELDQPGQTRGRMGIVLRPTLAGCGFLVPCQRAAASLSQLSRPRPGVLPAPGRVGHGRSLGLKWAAGGGLAPASRRRGASDHAAGPAAGLGPASGSQTLAWRRALGKQILLFGKEARSLMFRLHWRHDEFDRAGLQVH